MVVLGVMLGVPTSTFGADETPIITTSAGGRDAITFTTTDAGSASTLTVTNPGDAAITLMLAGLGDLSACTDWNLAPSTVAANRTTSVQISTACAIGRRR